MYIYRIHRIYTSHVGATCWVFGKKTCCVKKTIKHTASTQSLSVSSTTFKKQLPQDVQLLFFSGLE